MFFYSGPIIIWIEKEEEEEILHFPFLANAHLERFVELYTFKCFYVSISKLLGYDNNFRPLSAYYDITLIYLVLR